MTDRCVRVMNPVEMKTFGRRGENKMKVRKDMNILRQSEKTTMAILPSAESKRVQAKSKLFMIV